MNNNNVFLWIKATIVAAAGAFGAAFGWLGWLILAWVGCMVLDWIMRQCQALGLTDKGLYRSQYVE